MTTLLLYRPESLHGDAGFARLPELRRQNLLVKQGLLLGKFRRRFLRSNGTEHLLVAAPSRSGKGVGLVIPNLLEWTGSAVVLDIKLENHQITAAHRARRGQWMFLFNPTDCHGKTNRYNPLDCINPDTTLRINDIQKIAHLLLPNPVHGDPMWASEARKLFLAAALYLMNTDGPLTLGAIYRWVNQHSAKDIEVLLATSAPESESEPDLESDLDPACVDNLKNYVQMGEKQRAGVKSTLTSALELFDNPLIDTATSHSDFDFRAFRQHKTTLYIGVTPNNLNRLRPLINLLFQQCIDQLTQRMPDPATEPETVLLLMDEFAALGRMDILKHSIAFLAGYHLRLMVIVQSLSQLSDLYGEDAKRSMVSNFKYRMLFAPNDPRDADELSRELGTKTVKQKSRSHTAWRAQGASVTTQQTGRALMLPQEIKHLSRDKQILLVEATAPILCHKIVYYKDPFFRGKYTDRTPLPLSSINPIPPLPRVRPQPVRPRGKVGAVAETNRTSATEQTTATNPAASSTTSVELSDQEMDQLIDEFWNTGTPTSPGD